MHWSSLFSQTHNLPAQSAFGSQTFRVWSAYMSERERHPIKLFHSYERTCWKVITLFSMCKLTLVFKHITACMKLSLQVLRTTPRSSHQCTAHFREVKKLEVCSLLLLCLSVAWSVIRIPLSLGVHAGLVNQAWVWWGLCSFHLSPKV